MIPIDLRIEQLKEDIEEYCAAKRVFREDQIQEAGWNKSMRDHGWVLGPRS